MNTAAEHETFRLVVVSAGTGDPSATRLLADRTADRVRAIAAEHGNAVTTSVIELREIAADITTALTSQLTTPKLQRAITALGEADGVIAAAPVYQAGPSGLFTSFLNALDNDLLIAKPVVLAATAGTARHALVVDGQMRPALAFLRANRANVAVRRPGGLERRRPGRADRSCRARAGAADGKRLRPQGQGRVVAQLPARVRQRRRHRARHRPRHRLDAARDRWLRRLTDPAAALPLSRRVLPL